MYTNFNKIWPFTVTSSDKQTKSEDDNDNTKKLFCYILFCYS